LKKLKVACEPNGTGGGGELEEEGVIFQELSKSGGSKRPREGTFEKSGGHYLGQKGGGVGPGGEGNGDRREK